jgi:hypothetical protein
MTFVRIPLSIVGRRRMCSGGSYLFRRFSVKSMYKHSLSVQHKKPFENKAQMEERKEVLLL